jgi:hypothetical protein
MNSPETNANYRHALSRTGSVKLGRILLVITMLVLGTQAAQAQDLCPNRLCVCSNDTFLSSGLRPPYPKAEWGDPSTAPDLIVNGPCKVPIITGKIFAHYFKNVNILEGGILSFVEEDQSGSNTNFWASSIIVENGGTLLAGSPTAPFGSKGGVLRIYLWGSDQGVSGQGAVCVSPPGPGNNPRAGQCGIPNEIWDSKGASKVQLVAGGEDYFYHYTPLPFDDKANADGVVGYFGYKVLAVSYGGTLQLAGKKGATYASLNSGKSWTRLDGTILPRATSLKVVGPVDWEPGNIIVVTTTDYVPNHSEELSICNISGNTIYFDRKAEGDAGWCTTPMGVQWTHNGEQYPLDRLPARLNILTPDGHLKKAAETRAAVALLTRSIQIVSAGDAAGQIFPGAPFTYYFGGHVIARQGFAAFQIQGVEFRQLGQGGKLGHYPIHFHMARNAARETPNDTFVRDSSINESMTRWIVVHGTQGVELSRNVGYRSIGHGFYLEDAVETDNKFYSNLGIFARAAVDNADNPRKVPGILASPDPTPDPAKYGSDKDIPSVFWITNGWNDFQGKIWPRAPDCADPAIGKCQRVLAGTRDTKNGPPMPPSNDAQK